MNNSLHNTQTDKHLIKSNVDSGMCFEKIKSPSDTTMYAPALQRKLTPNNTNNDIGLFIVNEESNPVFPQLQIATEEAVGDKTPFIHPNQQFCKDLNTVTNFVETVRIEQHPEDFQGRRKSDTAAVDLEQARLRADKALVDAEKYKARVENPSGTNNDPFRLLDIGSGVSDDDFFHLTCHIDPNLIHKIEKGEFVELEKLLPKEKMGRTSDENRLEWVQRDGGTFLVPAQKDSRIGSFRRWEQAFRAYATIYCSANPHRSKEIWQYITVINTAATAYVWENVYNYDITFRHLMAFNPHRSWAVTYNQMWNLSMKEPLPKQFTKGATTHYSGGGFTAPPRYGNGNNPMQVKRNRSDYCWNFNKGVPCKFGSRCKFIERCKYCDSPSHGVHACYKLQKKETPSTGAYNAGTSNRNTQVAGENRSQGGNSSHK